MLHAAELYGLRRDSRNSVNTLATAAREMQASKAVRYCDNASHASA
jgi:hypothetical protein